MCTPAATASTTRPSPIKPLNAGEPIEGAISAREREEPLSQSAAIQNRGAIMAWIKVIEPEDATGELKAEYDCAVARAGKVFNIITAQSLNAPVLRAGIQLYMETMFGESGLTRAEREMLATVVSWGNHCFY
jgi:hypothetical protein